MSMKRFSAKLLFQYRLDAQQNLDKMRICEERIVTFEARTAKEALKIAKSNGRKSGYSYKNDAGDRVCFEFVGVCDLLSLDSICESNEVWYDIKKLLTPMERKEKLIPSDEMLIERAI